MCRSDPELLKRLCLSAVTAHWSVLRSHTAHVLPTALLEELLPLLTVCQLDKLQPAINSRGVSTYHGWMEILKQMWGPSRVIDCHTEAEAKRHVMEALFSPVLYGFKNNFIIKNASSLNTASFLKAAAKCIQHFVLLVSPLALRRLASEQRSVMDVLEKNICSISVSRSLDPSKADSSPSLLVLHRLLDHGCARSVVLDACCTLTLAWILHRRGSQFVSGDAKNLTGAWSCADGEHPVPSCKRLRLEKKAVGVSSADCPYGHIDSLELRQCQPDCLRVLLRALPSWSCLRSLTLHSYSTFQLQDVLDLTHALHQLSCVPDSGLAQLSISTLPCPSLMERLLEACPRLLSLSVEILSVSGQTSQSASTQGLATCNQFSLQKLSVCLMQQRAHMAFITSVLARCPQLCSLHVSGLRLFSDSSHGQLLATLSESSHSLRRLSLEDVNLSDSLDHILQLIDCCQLHVLCLKDCRLLEKWTNKKECLQRLVSALSHQTALHTLSLAQNRIARYVPVLAQLFLGASHSPLQHLDLSSNFIQPADLLEFSHLLSTRPHLRRFTLDLRRNPVDRDPELWRSATNALAPLCHVRLEYWTSTDTMADHISNM